MPTLATVPEHSEEAARDELLYRIEEARKQLSNADILTYMTTPPGDRLEMSIGNYGTTVMQAAPKAALAAEGQVIKWLQMSSGLSTQERMDLSRFIQEEALKQGKLSFTKAAFARVHRLVSKIIGGTTDSVAEFPPIQMANVLTLNHPFGTFFSLWGIMALLGIIFGGYHQSWPMFWTNTIPLSIAAITMLAFGVYEDSYRVKPEKARLFSVLCFICITISTIFALNYGQLPLGQGSQPAFVIGRGGTILRPIEPNARLLQYPSIIETLTGQYVYRAELNRSEVVSWAVPAFPNGKLKATITTTLLENNPQVSAKTVQALESESAGLLQQAKTVFGEWCNKYKKDGANPSLYQAMKEVRSTNYQINLTDVGQIEWDKIERGAIKVE